MLISEFRKLTPEELVQREDELRERMARLTLRRKAGRLEKPHELRVARKDLARLLTVKNDVADTQEDSQ